MFRLLISNHQALKIQIQVMRLFNALWDPQMLTKDFMTFFISFIKTRQHYFKIGHNSFR